MSEVFLKLFNMSIAAGWLILAVMVLRLLLKRAPKWLSCTLWAIVAIRLVCPVSFESSFSLIPSAETINPEVVRYAQKPTVGSGINMIDNALNPIIVKSFAPAPGASVNPLDILAFIAGIVWVIGLIAMLGYAFASFLRIRRKVQEAIPFQDNIWLCDAVKSPFILGIFKPQIYLSSSIDDEQLGYVLAHEQAHLKRKDHWWKILAYLLLAVYWFHPLVWVAYILFCRDIELACDEKVIKDMDTEGKKAYSHALVSFSIQRKMVIACPLAFGEISVKQRVKNILRYKNPALFISIAAIAICAVTAICFLTNPKINSYDIKIVVPANSETDVYYSDYEISPNKNHVVLSAGEGLGDSEVTITPAAGQDGANSEQAYITPGLPVKMDAKQGAWFKVGVNMSNPTDEDITVYVHAKDVVVRIFDSAANEMYDRIPMVMVNGKLYYDTGRKSTKVNRSSNMDGQITSTVEADEIPLANDQSNFGAGFNYQYSDNDTIEIFVDGKWAIFEYRSGNGSTTQSTDQYDNELNNTAKTNNTTDVEKETPEDMFTKFGVSLLLPENPNWIKNVEYRQSDENHMEIHYYDDISDADCKLLAVRNGSLDLPDTVYDESLEETWQGDTASGQTIYVNVQRSADRKQMLASWEYDNYKFAIQADIDMPDEDIVSIPKTILHVIMNL